MSACERQIVDSAVRVERRWREGNARVMVPRPSQSMLRSDALPRAAADEDGARRKAAKASGRMSIAMIQKIQRQVSSSAITPPLRDDHDRGSASALKADGSNAHDEAADVAHGAEACEAARGGGSVGGQSEDGLCGGGAHAHAERAVLLPALREERGDHGERRRDGERGACAAGSRRGSAPLERCGDGAGLTDALDGAEDEEHGPVDGEAVDDGEDADDGEAGDEQRLRAVYGAKPAALQRVDINNRPLASREVREAGRCLR